VRVDCGLAGDLRLNFDNPISILQLAPYIVGLFFLAGFSIILVTGRLSKGLSMFLSVATVTVGFGYSILLFVVLSQHPNLAPWAVNYDWYVTRDFRLTIGCMVDNLMAVMFFIVTSVSLLVQIYTHGYMRSDPGYSRFYSYLSLFTGSMLGLVVATNLFQTYFFWELVGVCSYFLIGFWFYKRSAAEAALKAFIVNRIGDCGFLIGILLLLGATATQWGTEPLLSYISGHDANYLADVIKRAYDAHTLSAGLLTTLSIFILLGPMAKSAQMPLHVWLPDAMEGPTPISALIHAATMVAAGVYLVARAYPLWLTPDGHTGSVGLAVIATIGGTTAFMAATIAMSQFDIKRVLAWSTVSQLGYMFVGLGCGAFSGGIFHLFNHAFFKAMLFLCSGAVIHGLHDEQDIRKMGGLRKYMPWTAGCFLIGTLSISGCPGLSGFFSKDEIIASACRFNPILGGFMILTAMMTAFYMFRLYFMTFENEYRGNAHPHESPPVMILPLVVLAIPSVVSGYLGFNPSSLPAFFNVGGGESAAFANHFAAFVHYGVQPEFEGINASIVWVSVLASVLGFVGAMAIYWQRSWHINTAITTSKNELVAWMYNFSFNKWRFDDLYLWLANKVFLPSFTDIWTWVDKYCVDTIVDFAGLAAVGTGEVLKYTQNGRGQYYALVIFAWVAGLTFAAYFLRP
jgi:NAD(P)H-quinone oxidoreductase subunit 5